jgi:hypothetical protein
MRLREWDLEAIVNHPRPVGSNTPISDYVDGVPAILQPPSMPPPFCILD